MNSLTGCYTGGYIGTVTGVIKGDTRRLDIGSFQLGMLCLEALQAERTGAQCQGT